MQRFLILLLLMGTTVAAQELKRPKLVVGIVVDQMRPDYLYRFYNRYTAGGFKRLMNNGFVCENTFIPYVPTYTAPGHSCVYTGSIPALHGIIGNNWFDREKNKIVYCTDDSTVKTVGSTSVAGEMSPVNLWATTMCDELRLATNFKSKTIGIALKDRGAILPAGGAANAAYWFDNASGGWVSSTYYMPALPGWMVQLNKRKLPDSYLAKNWTTVFPPGSYVQSTADYTTYENFLPGEDATFPHKTDTITNNKYEAFRVTPFGNSYTVDAAEAAIEGEALGTRSVTDFLAISFSSTDYIGHAFGPNSIEIEDTYLRLDKDLAHFFSYLDSKIGIGQYLVFLTADHAVAHVPGFNKENKLPGDVSGSAALQKTLNNDLQAQYGPANYIKAIINFQVYLNHDVIANNKLDGNAIKQYVINKLLVQPGIMRAVDLENLAGANLPEPVHTMLVNGYNQKLSGDVQFIYKPGWFEGHEKGTTHGSWNPYDAHIPLLWYGWGIKKGKTSREVYMTDIAPTVCSLLQIQMPNSSVGKVIDLTPGPSPN